MNSNLDTTSDDEHEIQLIENKIRVDFIRLVRMRIGKMLQVIKDLKNFTAISPDQKAELQQRRRTCEAQLIEITKMIAEESAFQGYYFTISYGDGKSFVVESANASLLIEGMIRRSKALENPSDAASDRCASASAASTSDRCDTAFKSSRKGKGCRRSRK